MVVSENVVCSGRKAGRFPLIVVCGGGVSNNLGGGGLHTLHPDTWDFN